MPESKPAELQDSLQALAERPDINALLAAWPRLATSVVDETIAIQSIPAPTFAEGPRAEYVRRRLTAMNLTDVAIDDAGNVWARMPGSRPELPSLMVSAHLDTVFAAETDLSLRHDAVSGKIYGPGLGDNSLGVAGMLGLARQLTERAIIPQSDIWWVATTGEEGLGDLFGMRRVCETIGNDLGVAIILEGLGLGRVYHAGLGVRRLRVDVSGPGGHSWLHSDRPSAIHHLMTLGSVLLKKAQPLDEPKTTFNIGLIDGGDSINSRASHASLSIDLRSEDAEALATLERDVMRTIDQAAIVPGLSVSTRVIGDRPFGKLDPRHPLVVAAYTILEQLHWLPTSLDIGSTDANVPLAKGIPAVCIGLTTGSNAHTMDENIDTLPVAIGMKQLTLLALAATEHLPQWAEW